LGDKYFSPTTRKEAREAWKSDFWMAGALTDLVLKLALNCAFLKGAKARREAFIAMTRAK
jgi:hypothetical protein